MIDTISPGPRIGHFLIDIFVIQFISYFISLIPFLELTGLLELLLFPAYYIFFEYYYQWTPGKYITGTIVVDGLGNKPDIQTIILRTFIRLVPFEPFSCLDNRSLGWHDRWSKTYVIRKESLPILKERLGLLDYENKDIGNRPSSKTKKTLLIVFIVSLVSISGYYLFQKIKEIASFGIENTISELNEGVYKGIKGQWESNWKIYSKLNFNDNNIVVATNQLGDTLHLNYLVNAQILKITDDKGLNLQFFIIELTENKMTLRDVESMKDNIEFQKK